MRQKFKKRILSNRKLISKLPCMELKDVTTNWFITWKDNPIVFKNIFSSVLMYRNLSDRLTNLKTDPTIASLIDYFTYWCCIHTRTLIISIVATTSPCYWFVTANLIFDLLEWGQHQWFKTARFIFWFLGMGVTSSNPYLLV